jgi:type III pantothenate kinase
MILIFDVGNTNITIALYSYEGQNLHEFRVITKKKRTIDELGLILNGFLSHNKISNKDIAGAIVGSVVPSVNDEILFACEKYLSIKPYCVNSKEDSQLKIPLKIKIDPNARLGADRIANGVGVLARYKKEALVLDFGTATVCDIIGADDDYLGGMISPGIHTSINALYKEATLLSFYKFNEPIKMPPTSLDEALHAGIFYTTLGAVEKITTEIKKELKQYKFKVIATGGLSYFIKGHTNAVDVYDSDLTTFGLYKIYMYNFGEKNEF